MLISKKYNFIFIHVWKTGGSSIRNVLLKNKYDSFFFIIKNIDKVYCKLNRIFLKNPIFIFNYNLFPIHSFSSNIRDMFKNYYNYFSFGFVRNPWDLEVSMYFYIKNNKKHPKHKKVKNLSFREYIFSLKEEKVLIQKDFLYDGNICLVDFVGKYENLDEDFLKIAKILNLKYNSLPKLNSTKHNSYHSYYDNDTKKIIFEIYHEDIKYFNYKF